MLVFLTAFVAAIYGGGFGWLMNDKGLLGAAIWPVRLGIALARMTERELNR